MHDIALYATNQMNPHAGYGKMELGLYRGLNEAGVDVVLGEPTAPVALIIGSPLWADEIDHPRRWAFTMSESTLVSPVWVDCLNACYERVLVPCPPLVDVYRNSGVNIPVHYVPLGVDLHVPDYKPRTLNDTRRVIMTYSLGDMRKNAQDAMMSWHRLFGDDERYEMVIKCRDNPMWLSGLQQERMSVVRGEQTEAQYQAMMDSAAVFVFASRGEGFGLPPREAVLMGIPTIATQWLGMWDAHEWSYPISVLDLWPAQFNEWTANAKEGRWANPSRAHLDAQLQAIIDDYPAAVAHTRRGREYLLKHFTWRKVGEQIAALLTQI